MQGKFLKQIKIIFINTQANVIHISKTECLTEEQSTLTTAIQHSDACTSQYNQARKGNKRQTEQKRRNKTVPICR